MKKILNSNNNRSKPKFLTLLWDIVVFRLVAEYDLFNPSIFIQHLVYTDFCINLTQFIYQFLETGTSFFLYSPFKLKK